MDIVKVQRLEPGFLLRPVSNIYSVCLAYLFLLMPWSGGLGPELAVAVRGCAQKLIALERLTRKTRIDCCTENCSYIQDVGLMGHGWSYWLSKVRGNLCAGWHLKAARRQST